MRKFFLQPLVILELFALATWLILFLPRCLHPEPVGQLIPLDAEALRVAPGSEQWMGIYFEDQKVGYAVSSRAPARDGGVLLQNRSGDLALVDLYYDWINGRN